MAHVKHDIQHDLEPTKAKQAAQQALDEYVKRYGEKGLHARWVSDNRAEIEFKAKGAKLKASVDVLPKVLHVEADIPMLLLPFKGKAISVVEQEVQRRIAQVRTANAS